MSIEQKYRLEKCLSTDTQCIGAFTIVQQLQCINDARKFAVRFLNNQRLHQLDPQKQKELIATFNTECEQILGLSHVNIVQHVDIYYDAIIGGCGLIMEMMDMSLTSYLHNSDDAQQAVPFHIQVGLSHDVAQALAFLHQRGIIHQNLTAKSVFLTFDAHTQVPLAKVGDFGMLNFLRSAGRCTEVPSIKFDIFSFGALVTEIMSKIHVHVLAIEQINSIISLQHADNPLASIVKCCFQEDSLSADILTMRIAKQAIAFICKRESYQLKHQELKSAGVQLQRSCDAVLDSTRNIIYLRQGKDRKLLVFNLKHKAWEYDRPDCNLLQCTLVFFQHSLLAIGGAETDNSPRSSAVYKLVEDQYPRWEPETPCLPTARGRSTALACEFKNNNILIVAGGEELDSNGGPKSSHKSLNTVEILTGLGWQSASNLPGPLCCASGTVVKDNVCLLGGYYEREGRERAVYTCHLSELVKNLNPQANVWSQIRISQCPVAEATCITLQDKLLIMGGTSPKSDNAIRVYNELTMTWDIIGYLPAPRYLCYAQALCKCRFLVFGGCKDSSTVPTDDTHIFELK